MATNWADIVAAALVQIDDVRLEEQMAVSPAQFYRRMSAMIMQAVPLLSRPPEFLAYLKRDMELPAYDDQSWTSTEESTEAETVIDTGMTGYELFSATQRVYHPNGTISEIPYTDAVYDAETGTVTMPIQESAGVDYDFDFYTDGTFADLSETQMRLFALAISVVWDERFTRNWLNITSKIHDDTFKTVNEASYTQQTTKRLHDNRIAFDHEMRAYEQLCAYNNAFKNVLFPRTELV